jgi:signal transduction histidine kinase/CheY-like chemotaxis protein
MLAYTSSLPPGPHLPDPDGGFDSVSSGALRWSALPATAQVYVTSVIVVGAAVLALTVPMTVPSLPLFAGLVALAGVTSIWKVNLPIPLISSSTLSVSCAANLIALLLLGPRPAVIVAVSGVLAQCTINVKQAYPWYRTSFSVAAEAITMAATGAVFVALGGTSIAFDLSSLGRPLIAALAAYFVCNTALVAAAIALSSGRSLYHVWRDDFLWSAVSFMVAGAAGAAAAYIIQTGHALRALRLLIPVYLTYRTYKLFAARLDDERAFTCGILRSLAQQVSDTRETLHLSSIDEPASSDDAMDAANTKHRLAITMDKLARLEAMRSDLLEREQTARAAAEQANQLKDQFLATVSHELRTPLNAILGWAEMLQGDALDQPRRARALRAIQSSAKHQAQLIDELLDVARIMSNKLVLDLAWVDLRDVVHRAVEIVQPGADAKHITIGIEQPPTLGVVSGDAGRLQQVVSNLLNNAVKFTPAGGSVQVRLARAGDDIELSVTDSGHGIPRDFLPSVFEPFRQADAGTTRQHGGLGLGLSIVRHLVGAHGGTVSATSEGEGKGARFVVRLPVAAHSIGAATEVACDVPAPAPARSLVGITVLVVDDDDESRAVLQAYLENRHARVLTAASAADGRGIVRRTHVDVILADVAMPGEDGYSLVRSLRSTDTPARSIAAIAVTAFARTEDRQRALEAGFQMHLPKPIDAAALIEAVATLGRHPPR